MSRLIINGARDLADWVADHVTEDTPAATVKAIVKALWDDNDSPNWGDDWSEYLDSLPADLRDMLPLE